MVVTTRQQGAARDREPVSLEDLHNAMDAEDEEFRFAMLNDHEIDIEDEPETLLEDTKENAPDEEDEDEKEAAVLVAADRLLDANNVASQAVMDAADEEF
jgi:hypothetical protein